MPRSKLLVVAILFAAALATVHAAEKKVKPAAAREVKLLPMGFDGFQELLATKRGKIVVVDA